MTDETPWYRTRRGRSVVVAYALVTLAVVALSTGWGLGWPADFDASVPLYVYLYGFLGGMTYAFTSLVAKFERGLEGVVRVGLRAIAALPLAAGVFLLAGPLGLPTGEVRLVAGLSFLVGLYVNVTLKALGGLADRLFGRTTPRDSGSPSPRPAPETTAVETERLPAGADNAESSETGRSAARADGSGKREP